MVSREQLTFERMQSLIALIVDNGTSASGSIPTTHVEALQNIGEIGEGREIAEAHRNGNPPP